MAMPTTTLDQTPHACVIYYTNGSLFLGSVDVDVIQFFFLIIYLFEHVYVLDFN